MQFLGILIFAIQTGFALLVIRSGRDRYWLYLILFLPGLHGNRHVRRAGKAVINSLDPQREVRRLNELIRCNPDYTSSVGHLLYAKTLEALGETEQALAEFAVVVESYAGEEACYRYALLLKASGKHHEAQKVFNQILARAHQSPNYYRCAQKQWIDQAKTHV